MNDRRQKLFDRAQQLHREMEQIKADLAELKAEFVGDEAEPMDKDEAADIIAAAKISVQDAVKREKAEARRAKRQALADELANPAAARIEREKAQVKASRPVDPPHDPETGEVVDSIAIMPNLSCLLCDAPGPAVLCPNCVTFCVERRRGGPESITDLERHPAETGA